MVGHAVFERYFNASYPLGPIAALPSPNIDPDIQRLIFDTENELYRSMNHGRTLLVGRKGSGKTSLLNSVSFEANRSIIIPLDSGETADIFTRVVDEIDNLSSDTALVEQVGMLWTALIWGVVFVRVPELRADELIGQYLEGFGLNNFSGAPYEIIDHQIKRMKQFPPSDRPVPQKIRYIKLNGVGFVEAKDRANDLLREARKYVFVLMDSLENYVLHKFQHTMALSGLLRCVGILTGERSQCIFRCCIPAEKYHTLLDLSENPLKDFQGQLLLHWDAGDLVQLAAKRYAEYIRNYDPDLYRGSVSFIDLNSRRGAFEFWKLIFPREIPNKNNVPENAIAYILRHTQLLPRHFLFILTRILERSIKLDQNRISDVSGQHVVGGIFDAENEIMKQILEAYRATVPAGEEACKQVLPGLPTLFTWDEFSKVVKRRRDELRNLDRTEVMQALIEIGAVGKLVGQTEKYNVATFEYMVPHRLVASLQDKFCVHPVFTETFGADSKFAGAKPVYTYWSEMIPPDLI